MKKRRIFLYILALSLMFSLVGCRSRVKETESETQSETQTETRMEPVTEKETQKTAVKTTSETEKNDSSKKTTVKPSTSDTDKTNKNQSSTNKKTGTTSTTPQNTQMCPYCYKQISTAPNGNGTTIYSQHVAQEKAWADTYGWGNNPPATEAPQTNATEAPTPATEPANDVAQCPYCYQWFTISDGTYTAHVNSETSSLGLPQGSDYVTCPDCGNTYRRGIEYDTHYCTGAMN